MSCFIYDSEEFRRELEDSPHRAGEVEFLQTICSPGMHVIEAGANRGVTAVTIAKEIGEEGYLYVFEPVPEYYAELKENLLHNGVHNVSSYELALSNRLGHIRFYKHGEGSGITPAKDAEVLWVEATTIADFIEQHNIGNIDLLSMDCEGSELLALHGAKNLLEEQAPEIFCEVHHDYLGELGQSVKTVVDFLKGLGYYVLPVQVEDLSAETNFQECSHLYAREWTDEENIQELEEKIADLNARIPAHSVSPSMIQELEELEERLGTAREKSKRRSVRH